ncbi:MAG: toll/interleukin-1 receptor domain-containing protein [Metallibacterium scheffleri]|jgi:tetratricopeptide (TPR) repeat protein|uniref:tetratricopeptide repeat protein n=1 Tax=Metallibacterium scheffleri TaxID=993689 RepID=UPI0026EC06AA|nr:toll/interleukin-1 receptor domain-containing protein [Metallibacterium scheffleri]MCK9366283.1 toll/interleukin-1 receptor domain-containing protein [Metallibacterium scheffleri]
MTADPVTVALRYRAFISYSHQDKSWADWLHRALEAYVVPRRLVGQTTAAGTIPRRLAPIFRDRDELASATDLDRKVNEALAQSANLIVICSPHAAASRWVDEEVLAFKRLGRGERIFCLIVAGEPNASAMPGRAAEECFVHALRHRLGADGALGEERIEPIAADARAGKDGKTNAKLKLIAGMLDVGFDVLKQRELQRRARRMTALAALALAVMALTTTLAITAVIARNAAEVAQQAAERRQKQAEGLVNFMLGDLNDKLAQVGRLDIMQAVDDRAMSYFESLPITDVTDVALEQRARALEKIGSVRLDQGHLPEAMVSYQAALKIARKLVDSKPADTPRQIAYAEIWSFIGMTHWRMGQLGAAQQDFESAQTVLRRAQMHAPDDREMLFHLAIVDNNIGHVLEARGQFEAATVQYRKMLALCERLVAAAPDNAEWLVALGNAHNNLGKLALQRGDLAAAVAQYAADDAIESRLAARDPRDNQQRENMLISRAILGRTLALAGAIGAGRRDLQQTVEIATGLLGVDAHNTGYLEEVALYGMQLSRLQRMSGDLSAAHALIERSLRIFHDLTRQDPSNSGWQRALAETQMEQAEQSRAAGQLDAARAQVQTALRILDPLFVRHPDDRATLLATVGARLLLAAVTIDAPAARHLRADALKALQAQKNGRDDPRLQSLQVEALLALGRQAEAQPIIRQLWQGGYRDAALVDLLQRQRIAYPVNVAFRQQLQAAIKAKRSP